MFLAVLGLLVASAPAQTNTFPATGNVGIGTTSPNVDFDLTANGNGIFANNSTNNSGVYITGQAGPYGTLQAVNAANSVTENLIVQQYGGNVGIGTTNPAYPLEVHNLSASETTGGFNLLAGFYSNDATNPFGLSMTFTGAANLANRVLTLQTQDANQANGGNLSLQGAGGNVGIGTTNPQYPLSVNGTIQAKEVLVNTGWADYVFRPDYRVKSLAEVATFIKANHHLPDIPSETEIKDKGVSLGDMQTKLLAKIEEITLQMIQLDAKNRALAKRVKQLEGR